VSWRKIDPAETPRDKAFLATNGALVGVGEFTDKFIAKAVYAFDQSIEPHTFGEMIRFEPTYWQPMPSRPAEQA
jgi:hypothetical protein